MHHWQNRVRRKAAAALLVLSFSVSSCAISLGMHSESPSNLPDRIGHSSDSPGSRDVSGNTGASTTANSERKTRNPAGDGYPPLGVYSKWPELLIASDFANAMVQIPALKPELQIISLPPPRTDFDRALEEALITFGYRIAKVTNRTGSGVLMTTQIKERSSAQRQEAAYIVAINRIALKRSFTVSAGVVAPISSLYVRGVPPDSITLNDREFIADSRNR